MRLHSLLALAMLAALTVAVALVGGWPDPGRSLDLLTGASVTTATESALIVLLCWLVVTVLAVWAVGIGLLHAARSPLRSVRNRALAAVLVGVTLLGLGVVRQHDSYRVCCATPSTAQQAEQLVH